MNKNKNTSVTNMALLPAGVLKTNPTTVEIINITFKFTDLFNVKSLITTNL